MKKIFHFICEHPVRILVTLALLRLMFHWGALGLLVALPISIMWENVDF